MTMVGSAVSCFEEGFSCSQAVLSTYGPQMDLDRETALGVASAFGGGIAHRGETCGAVAGALMVIGLNCGRIGIDYDEAKWRAYDLAQRFMHEFESRNGSAVCRELLGHDISTTEGLELVRQANLRSTRCRNFVRDAAEILDELLQ